MTTSTTISTEELKALRKAAHEAWVWMLFANEPDDESQTKEQYRQVVIEDLEKVLGVTEAEVTTTLEAKRQLRARPTP